MVDTSALFAIMNGELEEQRFHDLLLEHEPVISGGTMIESQRVVQFAFADVGLETLDQLLGAYGIEIAPVDRDHVAAARDGMLRFGKGRARAPAVLNFGDLFAYAAAKTLDLPLLFTGDDFAQTDVKAVPLPG
ncbi:MAG TPA: type II toxin-antitoxin system VapC family toxin [Geminicoccaceae bacterium]